MVAMSKVERKVLTLNERVDVLKQLESGKSSSKIGLEFGVSRTQIQSIRAQYFTRMIILFECRLRKIQLMRMVCRLRDKM